MKNAFTLTEVLITLGIVGVIAVLVMPSLVGKYQEKVFITKLEKSYSILSSAYKLAVSEHGSSTTWGLENDSNGAKILAEKISPYLNIMEDCGIGDEKSCRPERYADYKGNELEYGTTKDRRLYTVVLSDGSVVSFQAKNSSEANFPDGYILVDLNGKSKPNRYGVDYFGFDFYDDTLYPMGMEQSVSKRNSYYWTYCRSKDENNLAYGWACTAWVLANKNMDYIRCRNDLSWDGKKTCK